MLSEDQKDLMGKLLCIDPENRVTAAQALEHPMFESWQNYRIQATPTNFSFKKPRQPLDEDDEPTILRDLAWKCIQHYNPGLPDRDTL